MVPPRRLALAADVDKAPVMGLGDKSRRAPDVEVFNPEPVEQSL
jgi:hypothetical protein